MFINANTRILLLIVLFLGTLLHSLAGQRSNTFYHMYGVPQANHLNPAFQPDCKGYLGLPVISPLYFNFGSSSFRYDDALRYDRAMDQIITFMDPMGDKDAFLNALDPMNHIRAEFGFDITSIGWRRDEMYFSLDITERISENISFTNDLAELIIYGNENQDRFNMSGLGIDLTWYRGVALGLSYNFDDEFELGGRARLLFGIANIKTKAFDFNLKTSVEEWKIDALVSMDENIPLFDIPINEEGKLDFDSIQLKSSFKQDFPHVLFDNMHRILGTGNPGLAIDFGFNYHPLEFLSISASLVDLGFIRWRKDVYNFEMDNSYAFKDVEINLDESDDSFESVLDSLENSMNITVTENPYTTLLSGKLFLGAAYELNEKVRFGIVSRTGIYNYKFYNHITLSANVQPISMLSASLSYSIIGHNFSNFGFGLSLRAGPLNLYFITDQAPSAFFFPRSFQSINFRMGMNLVFGYARIPKALKDRPLIE